MAKSPSQVTPNQFPPVINANELYTFDEVCRRLRWKEHSRRQARRMGLKITRFGSRDYVAGKSVLEFYDRLAERHDEPGAGERANAAPYAGSDGGRLQLLPGSTGPGSAGAASS